MTADTMTIGDSNQSARWPWSNMNCADPTQRASARNPIQSRRSSGMGLDSVMAATTRKYVAIPTGTMNRKANRQL